MSKIVTYKGQLPIGEEAKIHLSTNDGLTGYKINKFQIISQSPGAGNYELTGKITLKSDSNIAPTVDFSDVDLLAVALYHDADSTGAGFTDTVIFDAETFNQDIFVNITDASGNTTPANYYVELEKFAIDLNTSTYHTLKNIRSQTQR